MGMVGYLIDVVILRFSHLIAAANGINRVVAPPTIGVMVAVAVVVSDPLVPRSP